MSVIERLKQLRDSYVTRQVDRARLPEFADCPSIRRRVVFSGYVQGVGFRFEVLCLAERLELTGWVRNLPDGRVEAELQGGRNRIEFLVDYMCSLKRASVDKVESTDLPLVPSETDFTVKM